MQQENINPPPSKRQKGNTNGKAWVELWDTDAVAWQHDYDDGNTKESSHKNEIIKIDGEVITDKSDHDKANRSNGDGNNDTDADNRIKAFCKRFRKEDEKDSENFIPNKTARTAEPTVSKSNKVATAKNIAKSVYKYRCHICSCRFGTNKKLMLLHLKTHGIDNNFIPRQCIIVKCSLCGATLTQSYKSHMERWHKDVLKKQTGLNAYSKNSTLANKLTKVTVQNNANINNTSNNSAQPNAALSKYVIEPSAASNNTQASTVLDYTVAPNAARINSQITAVPSLTQSKPIHTKSVQSKGNVNKFAAITNFTQFGEAQPNSINNIEEFCSKLTANLAPAIAAFTERVASASVAFIAGVVPRKAAVMNSVAAASAAFVNSVVLARDGIANGNAPINNAAKVSSAAKGNTDTQLNKKTDANKISVDLVRNMNESNVDSKGNGVKCIKPNCKDKCMLCLKKYKNLKKHLSMKHGIDDLEEFMKLMLMAKVKKEEMASKTVD